MTRTLYVIKTAQGYLTADGFFTTDPLQAISFVDLDAAAERVRRAFSRFAKDLSICPVQVQFPKPVK